MAEKTLFRPSPRFQAHILIWIALSFLFFILPFALFGLVPELGWLYLLIFLLANALWLVPAIVLTPLYCRSIEYEFAERDLLVRRGIITRSESMVPYRMVTNVEVKRGPIARALGIGTLKVHTAGFSQQTQSEATLNGLADWAEVRQGLLERIHAHQAEQSAAATAPGSDAAEGDVAAILGDILAEVRALREQR